MVVCSNSVGDLNDGSTKTVPGTKRRGRRREPAALLARRLICAPIGGFVQTAALPARHLRPHVRVLAKVAH